MHIDELWSIASDLGLSVPTSVDGGSGGQAAASGTRTVALSLAGLGVLLVASGAAAARCRPWSSAASPPARLALITCTGDFGPGSGRYADTLVVWAVPEV